MLSRAVWREGEEAEEEEDSGSWTRSSSSCPNRENREDNMSSLPCLKSILEDDWYVSSTPANAGNTSNLNHAFADSPLLLPPTVDSSSCSPSSVFSLDPSSHNSFFSQKPGLSSFLSAVCSSQFDSSFDFAPENPAFMPPANSSPGFGAGILGFNGQDLLNPVAGTGGSSSFLNPMGFDSFESSPFLSRGKVLRPLEMFPPLGAQPNLFQKRAAAASMRQNSSFGGGEEKGTCLGVLGRRSWECEIEKRRRVNDEDEVDDASIDGSGLNYDSEDVCEVAETLKVDEEKINDGMMRGNVSINNTGLGGGEVKGRRKGLPAKNLMAERRRRKKLNDRLYMLRSVVPKISKV